MPRGYGRDLYIQTFGHRGSFLANKFGWTGALTEAKTAEIAAARPVTYDGFKAAIGPTFSKLLVHCNPGGIRALNQPETAGLWRLSDSLARSPGFIGFGVGRVVFWRPLVDWRASKITREPAVAAIASRYREYVDIFETSRSVTEAA